MIVFIVLVYMLLGFVVGLLSKESKFDERRWCWLWLFAWPVLGIIVNRREDVVDDDQELHNKQLDILSKSLEEHLREKYDIPVMIEDECDGCKLQDLTGADNDHILTCLKCRRSYVEGSDERKEYSDYYIAEEEK